MRKILGSMIQEAREKQNLKREELAKKLAVSVSYVRHLEYENYAARFSDDLMTRVIRTLNLPLAKAAQLAATHNRRVAKYRKSLKSA